ncbi:P-loop containing nucleoside triphosphate hydrolase protein [Mytilinidion resinicola]|uniref:P-loop containing nucleoside triphosphate hydrolase protein n=1 Tax=Mytilinidion resinicola TaxID=574789 RepID=A0A6A6Z9S6_9PEZI|nr:P-loop containing nucleoside triphosphate hydrolase protein [Mytilinidion resinicola]KAF2817568.1 P-loop containing nucleoside triphosphate hydrolase protein [Mytilinidion resinicola]
MPVTSKLVTAAPSNARAATTPPSSPSQPLSRHGESEQLVAFELAALFKDILKIAQATQAVPPPPPEVQVIEEEKQPRIRASKVEFKLVNEIWDRAKCKYKIVETSESSEDDEYEEYLFIVRQQFDKNNKSFSTFLDMKSEELRDILRLLLKDVKAVCLREDKPTISPRLLFSFLPQLKAYRENSLSPDSIGAQHLDVLVAFLENHFSSTTKSLLPLLEHGEITFSLLWALFKPNTHIFTICDGSDQPRCLIYDSGELKTSLLGEKRFELDCRYLGCDGKVFGEVATTLSISEFRSTRKIASLNAFPLMYHGAEAELRQNLIRNGRKFMSLGGIYHCDCEGFGYFRTDEGPLKFSTRGRIMVDALAFKNANPNYGKPRVDETSHRGFYAIDFDAERKKMQQDKVKSKGIVPEEMGDEDLLICNPTVLGFSLANKQWGEFPVANIKDIRWDTLAFESLAIPEQKKEMLQALVEGHQSESGHVKFDDVISGKGQGLVLLLHGLPGVGKTLTAEGIAEFQKRPLYVACAGDLSLDPAVLEARLSPILDVVRRWGAVLLLDEADVFLERRSPYNLQHNSLVSVFLRQLEYFQGVMFLTTNRVSTFDEAMQSRVHLALRYDDLNEAAREKVWKTFLQQADATANISPRDLNKLQAHRFNGRQIKNTVWIGFALARNAGEKLAYGHLETAVEANREFELDFKGVGSTENLTSYV